MSAVEHLAQFAAKLTRTAKHKKMSGLTALERGNLVLAEVTAREIGRVTIAEALELTALVAAEAARTLRPLRRPLALPLARGS